MRRVSLLTALMMTSALLLALPRFPDWLTFEPRNRADVRLSPAIIRTLTVWLISDAVGDSSLLNDRCTAFERQNQGVHIYLRRAEAEELYAKDAILPDAALFCVGDVVKPESIFVPLEGETQISDGALASAQCGGTLYAAPLWLAPNVLCLPGAWFEEAAATRPPASLLGQAPPNTRQSALRTVMPEDLPWRELLKPGALSPPSGVALQQLLFVCPTALRQQLIQAFINPAASSAKAYICSLAAYQTAQKNGQSTLACVLRPAVSDAVRYAALCRDGTDVRSFLRFLLSDASQSEALNRMLIPATMAGQANDALLNEYVAFYRQGVLIPNAYAHAREELRELCLDAFIRGSDAVETLLRLR